jgi:hypothetical protein
LKAPDISSSEITPRETYVRRREFLASGCTALAALAAGALDARLLAADSLVVT